MRFTHFPRVEHPPAFCSTRGPRRAGKKDRYPLFPQLVTHHTAEAPFALLTSTAANGGKSNAFQGQTAWAEARADSRRLKLISEGLPNPWKRLITEIAISCDMSQTLEYQMNHDSADPKQKRERFQQLTQNPKVKSGKVFAADVRKSRIHPTVKKLTAWRKANRLSQPKAVDVLGQFYFHITFASLRSWEEGRRSPNPHTAGILEKFLSDHPTVERPKK